MLPNFVCPGAARSATTTLYYLLIQHPEIFLPKVKETRFFTLDYEKGPAWYRERYYAGAKDKPLVGDISPVYLIDQRCPQRIREVLGGRVKFIFMLRNPIERAYSHYRMLRSHQFEDLPFEEAIKLDEKARKAKSLRFYGHEYGFQYLKESSYSRLIQNYLDLYPVSAMKFVLFREFTDNTRGVLAEILEFLGARVDYEFDYNVYHNRTGVSAGNGISRVFYCNPVAKKVRDYIQFKTGWRTQTALKKLKETLLVKREETIPPMNERTREELQAYFAEEITRLEKLLGRDLSMWRSA